MKICPKKLSNGKTSFCFRQYIGNNKYKQIPQKEILKRYGRLPQTREEAEKIKIQLEAEFDSAAKRLKKRQEWRQKNKYHNDLVKEFIDYQKKRAPNSWKNTEHYLSVHGLPFFLRPERGLENIHLWPDHFDEFRDYLENDAKKVRTGEPIAYSSKNHVIKSINCYLEFLFRKGIIDTLRKCEQFGDHLLYERTASDLNSEEELELIEQQLRDQGDDLEADFYRFLRFTGMRLNEGQGVSLADFQNGEIRKKLFRNLLVKNNISYYGHIVLQSQPAGKNRTIRDKTTNKVPRKPLKGRKKISDKHSRFVPITDKKVYDNLMERMRVQYRLYQSGAYGSDLSDYLLFDGLVKSSSLTRLKKAYTTLDLKVRTWHLLRHGLGTTLYGETGDRELAKMWMGHSSESVFAVYDHNYEIMAQESKRSRPKRKQDFEEWLFGSESSSSIPLQPTQSPIISQPRL